MHEPELTGKLEPGFSADNGSERVGCKALVSARVPLPAGVHEHQAPSAQPVPLLRTGVDVTPVQLPPGGRSRTCLQSALKIHLAHRLCTPSGRHTLLRCFIAEDQPRLNPLWATQVRGTQKVTTPRDPLAVRRICLFTGGIGLGRRVAAGRPHAGRRGNTHISVICPDQQGTFNPLAGKCSAIHLHLSGKHLSPRQSLPS